MVQTKLYPSLHGPKQPNQAHSDSDVLKPGTYTALVTPFTDDAKKIDMMALERHIEAQIAAGVTGLVPCGTTGESPTLSLTEHNEVIRKTIDLAKKKALVVAGAGSNSTEHVVEFARAAEKMGADAVMVVVPYYNKPTQEGLFHHYMHIAQNTALPIVVYNIPGRSGVDLSCETLQRLADSAQNIVAVKEATGNVLRAQEIALKLGSRMQVFCGDDTLTLAMCRVQASGVISVSSNLYPKEVCEATRLALGDDKMAAWKSHKALLPVHEVMFLEANPGPVKTALEYKGLMSSALRLPLAPMAKKNREKLLEVLTWFDEENPFAREAALR